MPIKAENKHKYPKDWKKISAAIKTKAGNKCELCGLENGAVGWRDSEGRFHYSEEYKTVKKRGFGFYRTSDYLKIVLTVAHLDHNPENCADDNLKAMCQKCHLNYDHKHHMANSRITRENKKGLQRLEFTAA